MRISTRMTITLAAAGFAVFGVFGTYSVSKQLHTRRNAVEAHMMLLGRSLQVSIENALRDRQIEDIQETMETLRQIDPRVDIDVWGPSNQVFISYDGTPNTTVGIEADVLERCRKTREQILEYDMSQHPSRLLLALPLVGRDEPAGTLLINRPLAQMEADLSETRTSIIFSVFFLLAAITITGHFLGRYYIVRPLEKMAQAMQRVRSGDLSMELEVASRDEISALAREFNVMVLELREARQKLEESAEQRRRLEKGLQEAGKLITIGQLSAGLAHEIGSPLQILNGRARALVSRAHDPEATRRNAEIMVSQTDRITRIVEQLLQFARRKPARVAQIDLMATVQSVVQLLEIEARKKTVALTVTSGPNMTKVMADGDQIQQIVLNLLNNALAATPSGGKVEVHLEPGSSRLGENRIVPVVRLTIADTGCGIPPEVLPRLGEPFFTTRATEGGTGLGLAVVKALVNAHRGTLVIDSEPGIGTRFTVTLPVNGQMTQEQPS